MSPTQRSFSFDSAVVPIDSIGTQGLRVTLQAGPDTLADLASRNEVPAVHEASADLLLRPEPRGGVSVSGTVRGRLVQTCVVTLEAFEATLEQPVDIHFLPEDAIEADRAARAKQPADPADPDAENFEEPDPIVNGRLDLGTLAGELFTLGVDPYPRKPGVVFEEPAPAKADPDASPFAALRALKGDT